MTVVLEEIQGKNAKYKIYDALIHYLDSLQKHYWMSDPFHPQTTQINKDIRSLWRTYNLVNLSVESIDERRRFLNRPYLIALSEEKSKEEFAGGIWEDSEQVIYELKRDFRKIEKNARIHVVVEEKYRGRGIGSELIELFEDRRKKDRGIICSWDPYRKEPSALFEKMGYTVDIDHGLAIKELRL